MNKNVQKVVGWLKSSVPLVVVLGLTWITGVVVVEVEALPLSYLYTIMAVFQGFLHLPGSGSVFNSYDSEH